MALTLETLFWDLARLLLLGAGVLYVGLVLTAYRLEGPRIRLRIESRDPGRSAVNFLVWLGVKVLAAISQAAKAALDVLSDTSADVGEWYLRRRGHAAQMSHRSRFL
ncbi:MAG TPA: hypothetical protein VM182_17115 [Terriglobia bacterium]|nr:hypothetical protein [Terriglobia bacterium]